MSSTEIRKDIENVVVEEEAALLEGAKDQPIEITEAEEKKLLEDEAMDCTEPLKDPKPNLAIPVDKKDSAEVVVVEEEKIPIRARTDKDPLGLSVPIDLTPSEHNPAILPLMAPPGLDNSQPPSIPITTQPAEVARPASQQNAGTAKTRNQRRREKRDKSKVPPTAEKQYPPHINHAAKHISTNTATAAKPIAPANTPKGGSRRNSPRPSPHNSVAPTTNTSHGAAGQHHRQQRDGTDTLLNARQKRVFCAFCRADTHRSTVCPNYTLTQREYIVRAKGLCSLCLNKHSTPCFARGLCPYCVQVRAPATRHNSALCGLNPSA